MEPDRLQLTYTVESVASAPGGPRFPTVCVVVERFSRLDGRGSVVKHPLARFKQVARAAAVLQKGFEAATGYFGAQHPRDQVTLALHLRIAVIPAARALTAMLIPAGLAEEILAWRRPIPIEFRVAPVLNAIPWGLLFVGNDFLGFQHATGRQVLSRTEIRASGRFGVETGVRAAWVVDPFPFGKDKLDPAVARRARNAMKDWVAGPGQKRIALSADCLEPGKRTPDQVRHFLRDRDVVLVLGHHLDRRRLEGRNADDEGLSLWSGQDEIPAAYAPHQLIEDLRAPHVAPELLFWLACESGLTTGWEKDWPNDCRVYGFVDAAIRAGVPHFIGSSIVVPQLAAMDLVEPFFLSLAAGTSVGEALRRARVAARGGSTDPAGGGSLVGLAFCLFGRPDQGLFDARGRCVRRRAAYACNHHTGTGLCSLLYLPEDPGSRNQRCALHAGEPVPGIPAEPCTDPFQRHGRNRVLVTALEEGWGVGVQTGGPETLQFAHLCPGCLKQARDSNALITLASLEQP